MDKKHNTVRKLYALLTARERRNLAFLIVGILTMAFFEVLGVGAIGPFMSVAADPDSIRESETLLFFYEWFGFENDTAFLVAMGLGLFGLIVVVNSYTTVVMYWLYRWTNMRSYSIGRRLLSQYLHQRYAFYLGRNSSELSKNILNEVDEAVRSAVRPAMEIIARGIVAVSIFIFLFVIAPIVALVVVAAIGGAYAFVYTVVRSRLLRIGEERRETNRLRFKYSTEAFAAIKDVKTLGKEPVFEKFFSEPAKRFAWNTAQREFYSALPRYIIEAVALGLVVLVVVLLLLRGDDFDAVIPLVSVYAFAGYRLMPALQIIFRSFARFRATIPIVTALYQDIMDNAEGVEQSRRAAQELRKVDVQRWPFDETIELKGVTFAYAESAVPVLRDVSLTIPKNQTVAFVGPTGCGKTTLVDVILRLLEHEGEILVDGIRVPDDKTRMWQQNFGYVPQQIFLADDTVTRNIAFGVPPESIDQGAVEHAARIAHVHDFIANEMPDGYETVVGERGIRLSGGQRQRVGIARALYHDPSILIMDEATSALDTVTEEAVMDAIHELMGEKTIIMIAHRLMTIEEASQIFLLDHGRIVAQGTYGELLESSERFRAMARV